MVTLHYIDSSNTSFSQWLFASCYSVSFTHLLFKNISVSEVLHGARNIAIPLALTANLAYYFDLKFEHCRSCAYMLSHFRCGWLFETLAHQAPLSMGFSRHKYQIGLSCHSPGDRGMTQGWNPCLLHLLYWKLYALGTESPFPYFQDITISTLPFSYIAKKYVSVLVEE